MCLVPDADLFKVLNSGAADIVTGHIDTVTEKGVLLKSGDHLDAEILVTATGLRLVPAGGVEFTIDGETVDLARHYTYRGMMLSGVPNLALCLGYTNASWTLRADLASLYVCRLLNHMQRSGYRVARPVSHHDTSPQPLLGLTSGYVARRKAFFRNRVHGARG